jgi:hypothetical protein
MSDQNPNVEAFGASLEAGLAEAGVIHREPGEVEPLAPDVFEAICRRDAGLELGCDEAGRLLADRRLLVLEVQRLRAAEPTGPDPIDPMAATVEERQRHTLALLAAAERALYRVRMEGTFMTYWLSMDVLRALNTVQAAQRPNTMVGTGLHQGHR